jgi:hypothetical protein
MVLRELSVLSGGLTLTAYKVKVAPLRVRTVKIPVSVWNSTVLPMFPPIS